MQPRKLDDQVSVAPQLNADDYQALADAGFKTVVNNRPDGEEPGQIDAAHARDLAEAAGLRYVHLPVTQQTMGPEAFRNFAQILEDYEGPILAHCRSGTRSAMLWSFASAMENTHEVDDILKATREADYDFAHFREALEKARKGELD